MQGLQIWDGAGRSTLDMSTRVTQIFGVITISKDTTSGTGSVTDDKLAYGTPFYFVLGNTGRRSGWVNSNNSVYGWPDNPPFGKSYEYDLLLPVKSLVVNISGNTINYSWDTGTDPRVLTAIDDVRIYYGAF